MLVACLLGLTISTVILQAVAAAAKLACFYCIEFLVLLV